MTPNLNTHTVRAYVAWAVNQDHSPDRIRADVVAAGYTRTAANEALRRAGIRTLSVRSDKGRKRNPYRKKTVGGTKP